jgi:SAM-dependent methyltransferase
MAQHGTGQHRTHHDNHAHRVEHEHEHDPGHEVDLADMLDLDAELFGSYLDDMTAWADKHAREVPHRIVDLGAGTGTGSFALAKRFSQAEIVAIDSSASMLERIEASARRQGLTGRLRVVQADLDVAWPEVGAVDVAWAALSLHHVADPDRLLSDLFAALNPGGLLVVIEMDSLPRFLPDDVGHGRSGLETRLHDAMAQDDWNAHPDWRASLERAGFAMAAQQTFDIVVDPAAPSLERYARLFLSRARSALEDRLTSDDLDTLDHLLADESAHALLRRRDLTLRSSRTAWAARRP